MDQSYKSSFEEVAKFLARRHSVEVLIHPLAYDKHRIPRLNQLLKIVEQCRVSIRGWNMPWISEGFIDRGDEYLAQGCINESFHMTIEAWRIFKSCQFQFVEICGEEDEDWQKKLSRFNHGFSLDWQNVIYSFCEYFEFARRFASEADLQEGLTVQITYKNMANVSVASSDLSRFISSGHTTLESNITIRRDLAIGDVSRPSTVWSREAVTEFFGYFELDIREDILKQVQEEFFSMKIGRDRNLPTVE